MRAMFILYRLNTGVIICSIAIYVLAFLSFYFYHDHMRYFASNIFSGAIFNDFKNSGTSEACNILAISLAHFLVIHLPSAHKPPPTLHTYVYAHTLCHTLTLTTETINNPLSDISAKPLYAHAYRHVEKMQLALL